MGGQKVYMPTFNKDNDSLATDITGGLWGDGTGITADQYEHNVSDPEGGGTNEQEKDGSHDQYVVGETATADATYPEGVTKTETHEAKVTEPGTVMTMQQWIDAGQIPGPYWVVDTDGWAYWAQAIQPGTATGLLLDEINLTYEIDNDWYYAIDVIGDFASLNDADMLQSGSTAAGIELVDIITTPIAITADGGPYVSAQTPASVTAEVTGPTQDTDVTYTVIDIGVPSNAVTGIGAVNNGTAREIATENISVDESGNVTVATPDLVPVGTKFNVVATYAADPSKTDSIPFEVVLDINATNFPDTGFRTKVDTLLNHANVGFFTMAELNGVTAIDTGSASDARGNIVNMAGLEYFPELQTLDCMYETITDLDVSKNIDLTRLHCNSNQLVTLDLTQNKKLTLLHCYNNQLTTLDVTKNTEIKELLCFTNKLSALDVTQNRKLTYLHIGANLFTSTIDVSNNEDLVTLYINGNQITSLDISNNTKLEYLEGQENQISSLDLSNNTVLTTLRMPRNNLTSLDISKTSISDVNKLLCYENEMINLYVNNSQYPNFSNPNPNPYASVNNPILYGNKLKNGTATDLGPTYTAPFAGIQVR